MIPTESLYKYGGMLLIFLLGFIPFKEYGMNAWKWLFRSIGKAFMQPVTADLAVLKKSIDGIGKRMDGQEQRFEQNDAEDARRRILRFADEERHSITHSEEHYGLINDDIRLYVNFCSEHPAYKNMKATSAIELIKERYKEGNFLV